MTESKTFKKLYDNSYSMFGFGLILLHVLLLIPMVITSNIIGFIICILAIIANIIVTFLHNIFDKRYHFYNNWWYAYLFPFKIKIRDIDIFDYLTDGEFLQEILAYCDNSLPKNSWFFNQKVLYLRNKNVAIKLKLMFPQVEIK